MPSHVPSLVEPRCIEPVWIPPILPGAPRGRRCARNLPAQHERHGRRLCTGHLDLQDHWRHHRPVRVRRPDTRRRHRAVHSGRRPAAHGALLGTPARAVAARPDHPRSPELPTLAHLVRTAHDMLWVVLRGTMHRCWATISKYSPPCRRSNAAADDLADRDTLAGRPPFVGTSRSGAPDAAGAT